MIRLIRNKNLRIPNYLAVLGALLLTGSSVMGYASNHPEETQELLNRVGHVWQEITATSVTGSGASAAGSSLLLFRNG